MSNTINPVADDFYKSIEDLADYAGDVAMQRYKIELEKGCNPSLAASNAIEAVVDAFNSVSLYPIENLRLLDYHI